MNLMRDMARRDGVFYELFGGDVGKLLAIRKRVPGNHQRADAKWLTGDATPVNLAGVNWEAQECCRIRPGEVLSDFRAGDRRSGLISECELEVVAVRMVGWGGGSWSSVLPSGLG